MSIATLLKKSSMVAAGAAFVALGVLASPGNATVLSLSDDDFEQVSLGFDFDFFGNTYSDVFVGSNGYLTFGSGDTDFSESVNDFLSDQPRIAVWDDFNPNASGIVEFTRTANSFIASWNSVPEFFSRGANTFNISLFSDGAVEINLSNLTTSDVLVGISQGGGVADPGETDLSASSGSFDVSQTTYEAFNGDFDLNGKTLRFEAAEVPTTSVPEPASILGLMTVGALSAGSALKRKKKQAA